MYEVQCLDSYGNTINYFTQWDVDQTIVIPIDKCNLPDTELPSSPVYTLPEVHFCNTKRDERFVTRSMKVDDNTISAVVPNILLQEPYPLLVYVYMTDSKDTSSQKTILRSEIPVRKSAKPSDYFYIENISRITAEMIKDEIEDVVNNTRQAAIDTITTKKTDSVNLVESTKVSAINDITTTTDNAEKAVNNQLDEDYDEGSIVVNGNAYTGGFVNVGNDIISDLDQIKTNSLTEYNETVEIANSTQEQIENDINTTMNENGMTLQSTRDDAGNVDIVILLNQS